MLIFTDNPNYSQRILTSTVQMKPAERLFIPEILLQITGQLYPEREFFVGLSEAIQGFNHFFISEYISFSQYDMLLRFATLGHPFRENILCFAGSGDNLHGFRQRKWTSVSGNIHLSILLYPGQNIKHAEIAFLIIAANAVTQTINQLERMKKKAMNRWVNDIVIDQCKVGGILAQTQSLGKVTDKVVLGIGLNVDKSPEIENDNFVNKTTHINQHVEGKPHLLNQVLQILISRLERNYKDILENNHNDQLQYYIDHSTVIGKHVEIYSDPREGKTEKIAEGVVLGLTENLELILKGRKEVIRKGRLKLLNSA